MFSFKKRSVSLVVLSTLILQIVSPTILTTYADNTAYYVDATLGSDANDGLSVGTPWQTLAHVSTQGFLPGDQILLKCGETWTDTLTLDDTGAPGNEIIVGTYDACSSSSYVTLANTGSEQIYFASGAAYVRVQDITFVGGTGVTLSGADNIQFLHNRFENSLGNAIQIDNSTNTNITENYFDIQGSVVGVNIDDSTTADIIDNTFSGGVSSLGILNSSSITVSNNTFYNPDTYAISVIEDTSVPAGTVNSVTLSDNIILTWNPAHAMIYMDDQNSANGTLANVIGNTYINVYKALSPLIEILQFGASTITYNKDDITDFDATATTFLHFGYSSYNADGNPTDTKLYVNTGSISADRTCIPGVMDCSLAAQTDISGNTVTFPTSVPAYDAKIILWNNPSSIENPPTCALNGPPGGIVPNGGSVSFTWTVTNSLSTIFSEPDGSGGTIDTPVPDIGSGTYFPPGINSVNTYQLISANNIGPSVCSADITTQNNAPTPSTFFMTGSEDSATITGTVSATDQNGDSVTFSKFPDNSAQPANGTLTIGAISGLVTYTPDADFCGVDTFDWIASDQYGASDIAVGTITVLCENDTPVAVDDTLAATGGQLAVLEVTLNDTDPDSPYVTQTYTVSGVTLPAEGTLVASGATFEYTPNLVYMGTDSFTYVTIDQSGAVSNTGTVTVNVAPGMNLAPTVSSGSYTFNEDDSILGVFSGSDMNGDSLSYSAATLPANGILTIMGTGFSYVPDTNFNGTDSFDFVANDGSLDSNMATMSLNVSPIMDTPVAVDDTINVQMDTMASIDVIANDTDGDNPYQPQTLTLTGISAPTSGTASIVGNEIQYTPNSLYLGADTIEYVIEDQDGNLSNTGIVSITVSTTNQYPVADSGSYVLTEDIPLTQTLSGSDPDLTPVTFVLDTDVSNGTLSLSSTGEFTYTPDADYNGIDSFTFHVTDGIFDSTPSQTVTLTITAQNDNPLAVADVFIVPEDGTLDTTPLSNDYDADIGDVFVLNSVTAPLNGTSSITGSFITYTPNADYCGADTFEYTIIDQSGATSNVGSVSMTVTCGNDAPTASGGTYITVGNIDTNSGNTLTGTFVGNDIDGDSLSYAIDQNVANGTLIFTGNAWTYEPNIGYTGADMFTYTATDGTLTSSAATIDITVQENGYNDVPLAYSSGFTTDEDTLLVGTLSGYDLEGEPLIFLFNQDGTNGSVSVTSTGMFTYTPNADYFGTDTFTFTVSDGVFTSSVATGSITINAINDAPIAVDNTATGTEDTQVMLDPTLNDTDTEGDALMLSVYSDGSYGTVTASGNVLTYNPNAGYCGSDSVTYSVIDTALAVSNTGTINISLTCINNAPVGVDDISVATEDTSIMVPVLSNDTDTDIGDILSIANLTQPGSGGTVAISGTGILFTPTANFCTASPTTFTYQARDTASTLSAITTVTISSIACVNDTPTSSNVSYTMTGNVVINPGTMLSGGTLTGYLATENTLIRNLVSTDIDGDSVTFNSVTLPTNGTGTLSATGVMTYIPTPGYIGTDTLVYTVTDGTATSANITVTIIVQDPNPPVVTPPVSGPVSGPGGGGGGGSASAPPIYTSVVTSSNTSTGLTSQLLLSNPRVRKTTPSATLLSTYDSFILPITQIVEETKVDPESSKERATAIRQSGQRLMHSLTRSLILTSVEKSEALKSTESTLTEFHEEVSPSRESRALAFIIRLIKRERTKIEKGATITKYLLNL